MRRYPGLSNGLQIRVRPMRHIALTAELVDRAGRPFASNTRRANLGAQVGDQLSGTVTPGAQCTANVMCGRRRGPVDRLVGGGARHRLCLLCTFLNLIFVVKKGRFDLALAGNDGSGSRSLRAVGDESASARRLIGLIGLVGERGGRRLAQLQVASDQIGRAFALGRLDVHCEAGVEGAGAARRRQPGLAADVARGRRRRPGHHALGLGRHRADAVRYCRRFGHLA